MRRPRPYMDPYLAGVGLGVVLLAAYVVAGRGVGASGAFGAVASRGVAAAAPVWAEGNAVFSRFEHARPGGLLSDWLVVEILGVVVGGFLSAVVAGRFRLAVDRGPAVSVRGRLLAGAAGGLLMGVGAALARGCTSGQALSGGALLSAGSWLFIVTAFAGGYAGAPVVRRLWT